MSKAALLSLTFVVLLYATDEIRAFSPSTSVVDLPKQGKIRGRVKMVEGHWVDVYLGVPYSAEPERFMPPSNPPASEAELIADEVKPVCPQLLPDLGDRSKIPAERKKLIEQMLPYLKNESENCLSLNIYAPHEIYTSLAESVPLEMIVETAGRIHAVIGSSMHVVCTAPIKTTGPAMISSLGTEISQLHCEI